MSTDVQGVPAGLAQYTSERREPPREGTELGQDEFLKLMLTQIRFQDPMQPMQNGEFIGQLAQFSTVAGIEKMQSAIGELAGAYGSSQTLQASELVGREVLIDASTLIVGEVDGPGSTSGRLELAAGAGEVTLDVHDAGGTLVRRLSLGPLGAGQHEFAWDGRDEDGNALPPGRYGIGAVAGEGEGSVALELLVARDVDSVEFAPGGLALVNTTAGESLSLEDIRRIGSPSPER